MERAKLITAEEAQSILDACETMASVAAQMGLTTLLMGGDEPSLMDAIPGLARTVKALHAEVARLGAIIEGRTTPPTDAEFATHDAAGGSWRIVTHAVGTRILAEDGYQRDVAMWAHAEMLRDAMAPGGPLHGADVRWWALDAEGRPCAWPVVSQ